MKLRIPFNTHRSWLVTILCLLVLTALGQKSLFALGMESFVNNTAGRGSFALFTKGKAAGIYSDTNDWPGVLRAAGDLQTDMRRVSGITPTLMHDSAVSGRQVIIVGTIGRCEMIDWLEAERKIDVSSIRGRWEAALIQVVPHPLPGVAQALVICGSDKRGTIYGIYELSEQMGVSPWHYWADVPPTQHSELFVKAGKFVQGPPAVKYRGIFLNDEWPDLSNWIGMKYGTVPISTNPPVPPDVANYSHAFYTNIFELILRLKGNYLWPAMWNNAFNEDDTNNPALADEYGIVMGTSHQEPMLRAQKEWDRRHQKTLGSWNYAKYPDVLQNFWREGVRRNKDFESLITLGLRGANDTPMAEGGPEANMELLKHIVDVQRQIIAEEKNPDVTRVPQVWCLYKEVLDFYNAGMRVPDDVTLLWAEDNWGNVRRLPTAAERQRSGGAGVYYHLDYHGSPRNYQWLNTSPIAKVWDQMSLAVEYGADRVWIVNVGHLKGCEFPLEYFMNLAWNPQRWGNTNIHEYTRLWSEREFGPTYAGDIADIISKYTKYNGRRKPEMLAPGTYSLVNYQEAETVVADFNAISSKAEAIFQKLPVARRDAFYELVLFPTKASALVNELYLAAGKNALYERQGRASANDYAAETRQLFAADTNLMTYFNQTFAGGNWNHFMDQTHLGYTNWNDPPQNSLCAIHLTETDVPASAAMGVAVEGSESDWSRTTNEAVLPSFDVFNQHRHYIEVFNRGKNAFVFTASISEPWIKLSETTGTLGKDQRLWVSVDWNGAPKGQASGTVKLIGTAKEVVVRVNAFNPTEPTRHSLRGFVEGEGFVSIEPEHFTRNITAGSNRWIKIQDYGRTLSGLRATQPVTAPSATPGKDSPCLEYQMYLFSTGTVKVATITSPTLNFVPGRGLRVAISIDDEQPQMITPVPADYKAQNGNTDWEKVVGDNARWTYSTHQLTKPGYHTLKYWMVDPGVLLQKIVVDCGGVKPSYLGPPESFRHNPGISGN
ncbi:glycosyl hydrolase 115 family protein [Pedosphaera parvula]|uniref:Immunoglobulin I-set domain protein n=1 Tax=Pedosphaera parvula (strain Ellin514) TaxID=320771 RepID=B9XH28_PEDPL|nr:glycosyl hydrolase 115 family protein [Pedosphaera parvula]EEF60949.1 immunoglobulin I-set domain protein [Pedosphaera parvula Ellin514]